jgi:hypothetical protein
MEPLLFNFLIIDQNFQILFLQPTFLFIFHIELFDMFRHLIRGYHLLIDVREQLTSDLKVSFQDPVDEFEYARFFGI